MYPVSGAFLEQMTADCREIKCKVQIDYTDPFLDQSIEMTASENASVSYPDQTADAIQEPFAKIASLDGSWELDGTYALASIPEHAPTHQMGWWGEQLAGYGGLFTAPYPKLTATFFPRPIISLKVIGDSKRIEYPKDFTVKIYDEGNTLLHTETVTDNANVIWSKPLEPPITEATKMVLEITRWSHAGRQAKIVEFFTSVRETYEGDDIFLVHLLEEREVSRGSIPIGNISSNEIDVRLNNVNRKFSAGNKQSPLYQLLKANRRIKAWIGTEDELVPLGVFWSGDWSVPEDGVYAHTTGRDRLELLRKDSYSTSQVQQDQTLYELAEAVLVDAGLTSEEYYIDPELEDFEIPYSYFESQSHREALRKIVEACIGQAYCDRGGIIRVEGPSYLKSITTPETTITADDYYNKSNPVKWSEIANYVEVETNPLRPDAMQEVYKSNDPVSINSGQSITITAFYNLTPCIEADASLEDVTGDVIITKKTFYAWGADITMESSGGGEFTLVVMARPLKVLNKEKAVARDDASITDNGKLKYVFPPNPLIQTRDTAQEIADMLLDAYKNPRRDADIDWRGNPALLPGDRIAIADKDETNDYYIIRQELECTKGLITRLEGRKA